MQYSVLTFILFLSIAFPGMARGQNSERLLSEQMVIVLSDSWDTPVASLYALERKGNRWQKTMGPWPVVVGKNGMGWGVGQGIDHDGPRKREGDGKAPAGIFPLLHMMGYAQDAPIGTTFTYLGITEATRCIDDSASPLYNRIVEKDQLPPQEVTWTSAEKMRRRDNLYKWLIVTGYNLPDPQAKQGSCIFVHVWRRPNKGTAGCTALDEDNLVRLMTWLSPQQSPLLVQMPRQVFEIEPEFKEFQILVQTP